MNYTIVTEFPKQMIPTIGGPCLSIYMPTHRFFANNKHDTILFKNLVKDAKYSLEQLYSNRDIKNLMNTLKLMEEDFDLWNNALDGLALFATLDDVIVYRVEQEFKPISIISNSFHIKPLVYYFQTYEIFSILDLSAETFAVYEGNHHHIHQIELSSDVETTLSDVLGTQYTENYQTHGAYGGSSNSSVFHGHGGKSDEVALDLVKFFKHVDRTVLENVSKINNYPLILVAHKQHQFDFRNLSINPHLLEDTIEGSYKNFQENEIKSKLKHIVENRFTVIIDKYIEQFNNLLDKDLSSGQLIIILKALLESRVDTLFIEENKMIPGRIDIENQQIISDELDNPTTDDLLDDMVERALLTGSKVFILTKEQMPSKSGVAAIFRY